MNDVLVNASALIVLDILIFKIFYVWNDELLKSRQPKLENQPPLTHVTALGMLYFVYAFFLAAVLIGGIPTMPIARIAIDVARVFFVVSNVGFILIAFKRLRIAKQNIWGTKQATLLIEATLLALFCLVSFLFFP